MANTYDIGDVIHLRAVFVQGVTPVDPSTVSLVTKDPAGTVVTYTYALAEIIKDSTGDYHKDIAPTVTGTHRYRWTSTGTGAASEENWFQVRTRRAV